jgi:hypothetical protein
MTCEGPIIVHLVRHDNSTGVIHTRRGLLGCLVACAISGAAFVGLWIGLVKAIVWAASTVAGMFK